MIDQDSFWEEKLARPPFRGKRFTPEMMTKVERRVQRISRSRSVCPLPAAAMLILALGMLIILPVWISGHVMETSVPAGPQPGTEIEPPVDPAPFEPVIEPVKLELKEGDGGNLEFWKLLDADAYRGTDQTIIEFAKALMLRELGALSGQSVPADRLWEHVEDKKLLDRYDISSPWVQEVHIEQVIEQDGEVHYRLRLMLTDSTGSAFYETLRMNIAADTNLIREVQIIEDEDGDGHAEKPSNTESSSNNRIWHRDP